MKNEKDDKKIVPNLKNFLKVKPIKIGERKVKISEQIDEILYSRKNKEKKGYSLRMPKLKSFGWGVGSEKTSKEVDKILYGK